MAASPIAAVGAVTTQRRGVMTPDQFRARVNALGASIQAAKDIMARVYNQKKGYGYRIPVTVVGGVGSEVLVLDRAAAKGLFTEAVKELRKLATEYGKAYKARTGKKRAGPMNLVVLSDVLLNFFRSANFGPQLQGAPGFGEISDRLQNGISFLRDSPSLYDIGGDLRAVTTRTMLTRMFALYASRNELANTPTKQEPAECRAQRSAEKRVRAARSKIAREERLANHLAETPTAKHVNIVARYNRAEAKRDTKFRTEFESKLSSDGSLLGADATMKAALNQVVKTVVGANDLSGWQRIRQATEGSIARKVAKLETKLTIAQAGESAIGGTPVPGALAKHIDQLEKRQQLTFANVISALNAQHKATHGELLVALNDQLAATRDTACVYEDYFRYTDFQFFTSALTDKAVDVGIEVPVWKANPAIRQAIASDEQTLLASKEELVARKKLAAEQVRYAGSPRLQAARAEERALRR